MEKINVSFKRYTSLFGGMGFHNSEATMYSAIEPDYFNKVVGKCYREISPGFMRTWGGFAEWTTEAMDEFYEYYTKMQQKTDTTIYLVPGRGISRENPEARRKWASDVADNIEYLYNKGMKHIRYYCMSNELSLDGWGAMTHTLDVFKEYQEYLWREFQKRNLPVGLLATDAAHYKNWNTIEWAMKNISYMTDAYCGHYYIGKWFDCEDMGLYKWTYNIFSEFSEMSKAQEKRFILGEYGWGENFEKTVGSTIDVPRYVNTEKEAYSFLSLAEVTLAALNAGVYTMSFWTFMDYPDPQSKAYSNGSEWGKKWNKAQKVSGWGTDVRYNKCGLLHWSRYDDPAYDGYWCLGLMSRYLRKDSRVMDTVCLNDYLRMGTILNCDGTSTLCIVNRHNENIEVAVNFDYQINNKLRVYRYDSDNVPRNKFADLQSFDTVSIKDENGEFKVTLHPNSVTVLTSDYVDRVPSEIKDITLIDSELSWQESEDKEHCYYRVYENGVQIASTIENHLKVIGNGEYTVYSVDIYGNTIEK